MSSDLDRLMEKEEQSKKYWEMMNLTDEWKADFARDFVHVNNYQKSQISFSLDDAITEKALAITKHNDFPLFSIFMACLQIELYKYNGKTKNIIGIPIFVSHKENRSGINNKVLPFFTNFNSNAIIKNLILQNRNKLIETYQHSHINLENLLRNSNISNSVMELTPISLTMNTLHLDEHIQYIHNSNNNEITISIEKTGKGIVLSFVYNATLFTSETIHQFGKRFLIILTEMMVDLAKEVKDVEMITSEEKHQILKQFNLTKTKYPADKTIQVMFEEEAQKNPNKIAVVYKQQSLTYQELNEKSNQMAWLLQERGVKVDSVAAIMGERSIEMIIGILGILKSGGTYLPIDPSYPKERINFMLKDAEVDVLLIRNTITQELEVNIPELNVNDPSIEMKPKTNLETISHMEDFAYIIYTSGSTGNPKGVPIKHKSVINLCTWFGETYNLRERRHVMHNTSISFDVSVEEVFGALLNGGTVYITTYEESTNRYKFRQFIQKHDINIVQLVPTTIQEFIVGDPKLESVDVLISGGEALPNTLKNEVIDLGYDIYNCYGPTETTVDALTTLCGKDKSNVIGKPIANTRVYITNRDSQLQPIGLPGELYISGEGLSIGYLNRSELTEEKFVANLFETKSKMYKTGDLVKWLPDGSIEFIGRLDHQVKIRGFRIELGEIENKLSEQPFILQSVVLAWENDNQGKYLCAYLLGEESIDIAALRNNLKKELPHYMVPTYFIQVESIPLTPNGKVDRKILPKPDTLDLSIQEYVAPSNVKEKRLVEVCSEILGVKKIGIHEDFFDLGGDSIKAIRLISKLQKFGFTLEVKDIFDNSNLKAISLKMTEEQVVVDQKTVSGDVLLTPIQRMFFEKDITDVHHWNQAIMLYGRDGFRVEWIEKIFDKITCHHDALRMVYRKHNGKVKQINRDIESNLFSIDVHDLRKYDHYEGLISLKCNELQSSIDLENGPLVKLGIFQTKEGDYLLIAIHHLVIDGVSWRILLEDFTEGYNLLLKGKKVDFQPKSNSYQEWADFLQEKLEYFQQELPYWNKMEQQHIKPLPTDFEFQEFENKQKNAREVHVELNQSYTEDLLKRSNQAYNTEINDLLLAALTRTIYQWTNEKNILINLEGHGRDAFEGNININRTIGWFTAQYPLLLKMEDKSTSSLIKHTKESLRKVPNKGIGYGILKYLSPSKPWNNREPEISFNYLGQFDEQLNDELFEISSLYSGETVSPNSDRINEIDINGMITNQKLSFSVSYNSLRYRTETIRKFLERFKGNLIEIIHHCLEKDVMEYTVSDYSDEDLTTDELKNLKEAYEVANKTQITNIYPLSPMQEGMLFHSLVQSESSAYFDQTIFTAKGIVDMELVQKSFQILINKYDILRTVIAYKDVEKPRQVVLKERKPMVYFHDLSSMDNKQLDDRIEKIILEDRKQGFNLSKDVLMRLFILKQGNKEYKVIWSSHHILMDGWSTWILLKDFFDIYSMLKNNNILEMDNPKQYGHYIDWLQKQNRNHAKQYWYQYLEGYETNVKIPSIRTHHYEYMVEDLDFVLNKDITNALTNIAKSSKTTLNTIIQVVWGILLQQYNQTNDVVFGSVVSGRNYDIESLEEMVGLFINMIPVRITSNPKQIFIDLLKETQNKALESSKYDYYPLADIQSLTDIKSDLITSKITFQNYYIDEALVNFDFVSELGFTVEDIHGYEQTNYDFNIKVIPSEDTKITFSYNKNVHDSETVINLKNHFIEIIQSVIQNQEIAVSQISMTTDTERKEILHGFNDTSVTYPKDKTISQLWEEQVEKHPHHIAVECEGKQLTYQALNEKANQLARTLRQNGITANAIVGMMIDGSLEMMVGMIGILKAGGAYLPIDSTHPIDRINYMIEDAKLDVLVTTSSYANKTAFAGMIVNLADSSAYQADSTNLDINHESRDLAYVMYTSGTTGKAKGVMVSHANVINYTVAMIQKINLTSTDETALLSSYAFDLGYTTIYTALLSGTTLHIASESTYKDPNKLVSFIGKHCTYVKMTPSLFSVMMQSDELDTFLQTGKLRLLILGGESLNRNDLTHFFAKDTENKICFMNHYGPTETTIGCVATEINRQEMIEHGVMNVIGKPLANVKAYMLDPQQNLCPIGVKGELYVSGAGVAQGYLYNPELTEVKFLDNPFEPGERMYRTGDLARFLPDGRIEFLGRIDNQVKIRGYRVELGEIEHQLRKQPLVSEATVFVKDEAGEKLLVAYFVGEQELDIASIRDGMKEGLPHYMIPTYFVQVEKMPLTRNGKLNKYALPEPAEQHLVTNDYVAPRTSIEQTLAAIWSEVLGIDKVGIHDNFFDLGGDSIKAIRIVSGVQKHGFKLAMNELFKNGTIHSIREQLISFESKVSQEEVIGEAPLIPIQKMFFEHNFTDSHHWNQSVMIHRKEGFREDIVREVLTAITKHHDALRMVYQFDPNGVKQIIRKSTEDKLFDFQVFNYRSVEDHQREIEVCSQMIQRGLDIENGPLVNVALFQTNEGDHLLFVIHHLVIDGVSWRILLEDFTEGYHQVSQEKEIAFQKKTNSFRDWGIYLTEQLHGDVLLEELEYWKQIGRAKGTGLPVDKKDQGYSNKAKYYCDVYIEISKKYTEDLLKKTNKAYNTEINDILLTALGLAIHDWTAENQILLMLEGHGRETLEGDIDISRTIGWFTTHYPVLLELDKSNQIAVVIKHVKEILRHVPNKGIGYGILEYLEKDRDETFNHINSSIKFNYLGQFDENTKNGFFNMSTFSHGDSISLESERLFDIDISGMVSSHQLEFRFSYNSKKYHESTMKMVAASYKSYLLQIIEHCQKQTTTELTPSDYADQSLTLEELEELTKYYHSATIQDIYPLTPMQEGMLFYSLLDEHSTTYFEQKSFICKGNVHLDILEQSFIKLIERYEILRSVIVHENVQSPKQVILKTRKPMIHYEDLSTLSENERTAYVEKFEVADRQKGFSLSQDILIRLAVLKLNAEEYKMIWSSHHILMDGWCNGLIMKDFFTIYSYLSNGTAVQLPDTTPYVEYIKWLQKQPKNKAKQFWQQYVEGYTNQAKLPGKEKRSEAFTKERLEFTIDPKMTEALKRISKHHQVTLNNVIQTAWGILLQKNTNLDDVVFGSVVSGRNAEVEGIEEMVGLFINTVPVRVKQEVNHTFIDVVKQMQKDSLESARYDYYPLADIQSLSEVNQELVHHIIIFQNYYSDDQVYDVVEDVGFKISESNVYEQTNYDFDVMVLPKDVLEITFSYNKELYDKTSVIKFKNQFTKILQTIIETVEVEVADINILTELDSQKLLQEFNQTNADYPKDKSLHTLFEEQAEKNPHHIAVVCAGQKLTYQELNKKANQLARVLRQQGVQNEAIVGLIMDRSIDMIIGIMGILKAGGAYLPIDPTHPTDRIQTILSDAKVSLVVTSSGQARSLSLAVQAIDITVEDFYQGPSTNLDLAIDCHQLAYVIYTSGSTGTPKGVMVEHQQVTNFIYGVMHETNLGSYERILCLTTVSFDIFGLETFVPLTQGLTVVMAKEEETREGEKLAKVMTKHQVDVMQSTPTRVKMLLENDSFTDALMGIKALLVGGEELSKSLWEELQGYPFTVFNMYGPTETTIWSTVKKLESTDRITIGKPIQNTELYLMDSNRKLVPIGVHGELCIGGDGVARGYFNREALTKERFIDHPFKPGERLYRTGDLARWLPNGELEYLGRMDNQVKVRGYRIELGEIESRLISHPAIKEAVVVAREDEMNQKYLCAYIVAKDFVDKAEVRTYVKEGLPDYMVPAYYMELQTIPLTHNGKVNRKALPKPEMQYITNAYEAPQTTTQKKLVIIWQHVLGVDTIGIHDNFFDLGGHSLKATMVMGEIHKALEISVPLKEIFNRPTIQELSDYIETEGLINPYEQIKPCEEKEYYQTSSAQKRMYTVQQLDQESTAYNMPAIFELEGEVNRERMEATFRQLIERHEVLRTSYKMVEGEIAQKIMSHLDFHLRVRTVDETDKTVLVQNFIRPFSLEEAPLFRAEIMKSQGTNYLLIDMHHIISDGVSMSILVQEFAKLYNGDKLDPLRIQYKDYAEWEQHYLQSGQMKKQARYWKEQFQDEVPVLQLPYDFERPAFQRFEGDSISFTIDEATTKQLQELAKQEDVTMHMVLLSAFTIQLARYSGQEDIVVGVPIAGRPHADLQNIMGMFVNTLAMRHRPNKHKTFSEFLKEVKENSLQAYDNQNYQLEELIEQVNIKRDVSRNFLFDVVFNLNNIEYDDLEINVNNLRLKQINTENELARVDLSLTGYETSKTIALKLVYATKLFKRETIQRIVEDFLFILREYSQNIHTAIKDVQLINSEEEAYILNEKKELDSLRDLEFDF